MSVQVQLPGWHQGSASGLADIIGAISGLRHNSAANDLIASQKANEDLKNKQMQIGADQNATLQKALVDPNSPETKMTKSGASMLLNSFSSNGMINKKDPNLTSLNSVINDPNTTGLQVHQAWETSPVVKSLTGMAEAQTKANAMLPLAQARMAGVDNQKDRIATSAADHFDKDPILIKIDKQRQQIALDKHTLEASGGHLPVQLLNEIQQGLANAISGGGSAGLGKTEQIEINNSSTKLTGLLQKLSPGVKYVDDPELAQYLGAQLDRLGNGYDNNAFQRAQQIFKGRAQGYKSNPAAVQVMQDKVEGYRPQQAQPQSGAGPGGAMSFEQFMASKKGK